jgi:hypothetical protein
MILNKDITREFKLEITHLINKKMKKLRKKMMINHQNSKKDRERGC